jgi:hypothetical protein
VEGQNPGEAGANGNITSGEGQPAVAQPQPAYRQEIYSPPMAYAPPPAYAPPAAYAPPPPQAYAPYPIGPPPANRGSKGTVLLIIGMIVVLLLAGGGVGAVLINASLANTYSDSKTVSDYLAAQKKGDSAFMLANANFLKGDGSYGQYFDSGGLNAMLAIPQNTDISDVNIASTTVVDANTNTVNVTMTWAGHHVVRAYTVHRDLARVHYNLYNSWRLDIPFATINLTLPNQPGSITVDGLTLPQGAIRDIQVIQGFHKVAMEGTDLYDSTSMNADTIDGGAAVVFLSTISANAIATAKSTIKKAFNTCDAATNAMQACLGRTYHAANQPGFIYYFNLPGYGEVDYKSFVYSLTSDPTNNMKLVVGAESGKLAASGACAYTMTVDGSRKYNLKGTWTATLTVAGGSFGYNLTYNCTKSKA